MQYGNVNSFGLIPLTDDDKISILDMSNKLNQLVSYLQNWDRYDEKAKTDILNSYNSFLSATGYYFTQQGSTYWKDYGNRNELFKFLSLYGDGIYHLAVCYALGGSVLIALSILEDAYFIFPPEHPERHAYERKIKEFVSTNPVKLVEPKDIDSCSSYLLKNIHKYLN